MYLDLEKMDEAAAMFSFLTSSGALPKTHVFYEQVHSFCSCALGLVDEPSLPTLYLTLTRFQSAIQFDSKPVASYLLTGRGKHGIGRRTQQTMHEFVEMHNLNFLNPRTVVRNTPPGHFTSGVIKEDVELCIKMCIEKECLTIKNLGTTKWQ